MRRWVLLSAVVCTALSNPARSADDPAEAGHKITNPDWLKRPTADNLLAVFPSQAYKRGISGKATISCTVTIQGALNDCTVVQESPPGAGFGGAAIALTPQFMMKPATMDGTPVPSTARIPINFEVPSRGLEPPMPGKRVITANIAWVEAPSYADVAAAYPKKAQDQRIGGRATLVCDLSEEGRLKSCQTAASEPKGYGFDTAAKALAKSFRIEVASDEDRKVTRTLSIHLPVTFDPSMLDPATRVIGKPNWVRRPNAEQMQTVYRAVTATGTAKAALQCEVQIAGLLRGCKTILEEPLGAGVGIAAMALAPTFRLTTWTSEGLPTIGGLVRIPIRFEATVMAAAAPVAPVPPK